MKNFIKILIGLEGQDKTANDLKRLKGAADEFIQTLKAGVGIDIGGKLVDSVARIPAILQEAVARGVAFNREMADSEVAIANVVAKFRGLDQAAAKQEAAKAMKRIKELEPEAAGSVATLTQGFLATYSASAAVGVSVEQNAELVAKFSNALSNANIPAEQLSQELRAIFTGNITPDAALGKLLQITNEDVANAKEAGNLYNFLVEKVGELGNAGDTSAVRLSSLGSAVDQALGKLALPVTKALDEAVVQLTDEINKLPDDQLKAFGEDLAQLVKAGANLTLWLTQNSAAVLFAVKAVGMLSATWAALKLADIAGGLLLTAVRTEAIAKALTTQTAAVATNTIAWRANAAAQAGAGSTGVAAAAAGGRGASAAGAAAAGAAGGGLMRSIGGGALRFASKAAWHITLAMLFHEALEAVADTEMGKGFIERRRASIHGDGGPDFSPERRAEKEAEDLRAAQEFGTLDAEGNNIVPQSIGKGVRQRKIGDELVDVRNQDVDLSKEAREAALAGMGEDELLGGKMQRAEELRGQLRSSLGLRDDFTPQEAADSALQSGTAEDQKAVLEAIKEMAALEKEIEESQAQQLEESKKLAQEAKEREGARQRALQDLREEQAILEAEVAGDERRKIELEAQLTARREMQKLIDMDVPEAKALAEATRTAELEKQVKLKALDEKTTKARENVADLDAEPNVDTNTRGGRGARKRRKARDKFTRKLDREIREFRETGGSEEEAAEMRKSKLAEYDQNESEALGRFGSTSRSTRDNIADLSKPSADFLSLKSRDMPDAAAVLGSTPADPSEAAKVASSGGPDKMQEAGNKVQSAADQLSNGAEVVSQLATVLSSLSTVLGTLGTAVSNLEARVNALNASEGT